MANAKDAHTTSTPKILLLGDTGAGKTTQVLTFPGKKFAYLFDPNAILSLQGHDIDYEEYLPDKLNLSVKSLSKAVGGDRTTNHQSDLYLRWEKDFNDKVTKGFFNEYSVIMFDSATTLLDIIMDRVLTINGRAGGVPQQDDYSPQMLAFQAICRTATALNKTVVMTGHLDIKKDELQQRIFRQPMMTGRLKTKIPLLFSDILVCEVESDSTRGRKHKVMTIPDRITTSVRTSMRGLSGFEDVTIDWTKPVEGQGIGGLFKRSNKK